jgi:hypothetical protein
VMKTKPASIELARLHPFVGVWGTEGEMKTSPSEHPAKFRATGTYEWLPGPFPISSF